MNDVEIELDDQPGALAAMGETLARAGVSVEGGGVFVTGGRGVAHFLFADGEAAREALERGGIRVGLCTMSSSRACARTCPASSALSPGAWLTRASTSRSSTAIMIID